MIPLQTWLAQDSDSVGEGSSAEPVEVVIKYKIQ